MERAEEEKINSFRPITIRYRFNMAPDHKIITEPSLSETMKGLNKSDVVVFLSTVLIPSFYGYRLQSKQ